MVQFYNSVLAHAKLTQTPDSVRRSPGDAEEFLDPDVHPGFAFNEGLNAVSGQQLLDYLPKVEDRTWRAVRLQVC